MRKRRCSCCGTKGPVIAIAFGGALVCLCCISAKILLVVVALLLIVLGLWLLKCT